jgi:hypothetical protein
MLLCQYGVAKGSNDHENWLNLSGFEPGAYRNFVCYRFTNLPS